MKIFDMMTNDDIERIKENQGDLAKRVKELNNSLSIALEINDNYQRENKKLKEKVSTAEGETSIVFKGRLFSNFLIRSFNSLFSLW